MAGGGSSPHRWIRSAGTPPRWPPSYPTATRVLDAFHVVKLALTCVDEVRRRVQQDTLGHRGLAADPLFRTRRLLRRRADRLTDRQRARLTAALVAGDPNDEVTAAWLVAQQLMAAYANPDRAAGRAAAEKAITTARTCPVPEITRLGRTLTAWRTEFLARFDHPGVSNGPTECLNLKVKNTKRDRPRLPVIRQLQAATTSQPRTHQRRSSNDTDPNPTTQVRLRRARPMGPRWSARRPADRDRRCDRRQRERNTCR